MLLCVMRLLSKLSFDFLSDPFSCNICVWFTLEGGNFAFCTDSSADLLDSDAHNNDKLGFTAQYNEADQVCRNDGPRHSKA